MANCKEANSQMANWKNRFFDRQVALDKVLEYFKAGDILFLTPATKDFRSFYWKR